MAHEKGIIHRDLKPANIKITSASEGSAPAGRVKILDFGLAKAMAPAPLSGEQGRDVAGSMSPTLTLAATMRGEILGTAAYMAPEQARGLEVDKRADVWAFGVCLFEALTGKRSFEGRDATDTLAAVLRDDLDWEALPRSTPRAVRRLLERSLQREPHDRLRDIGDAALELRAARDEEAEPSAGAVAPEAAAAATPRSWVATGVVALVVAALAATAAWIVKPEPAMLSAPVARFALDPGVRNSFDTLAISPDGNTLVAPLVDAEGQRLYYRRLGQESWIPIRGTEDASAPFFSPDGEWVGFFAGSALKKVALAGGPAVTLTQQLSLGQRMGASWSIRGEIVFAHSAVPGLFLVDAAGGVPQQLPIEAGESVGLLPSLRWPSFMPDGQAILFASQSGALESAEIAVYDLDSGETTSLTSGTYPRWANTGHLVLAREGSIWGVVMDPLLPRRKSTTSRLWS